MDKLIIFVIFIVLIVLIILLKLYSKKTLDMFRTVITYIGSNDDYLVKEILNDTDDPYLEWIKSGVKKYEGRLKPKIKEWDLYIGKRIKFVDSNDKNNWALVEVISLPTFANFGDAYDSLGEQLIPYRTHDEVVNMYDKIFKSNELINKSGVVAIGFKLIEIS